MIPLFADGSTAEKLTDFGIPATAVSEATAEEVAGQSVALFCPKSVQSSASKRLNLLGASAVYVAPADLPASGIQTWLVELSAAASVVQRQKQARTPSRRLLESANACNLRVPDGTFGELQATFETMAEGSGAPLAFVAHIALGCCAGIVTGRFAGSPWQGWSEPAVLNCLIVGSPSSNKSPAINAVAAPIRRIQGASIRQHIQAMNALDQTEGKKGKPSPPPSRTFIQNTSVEAALAVCATSDRGLLCLQDEFSAWLQAMTRYRNGGGSDRPLWLEAWTGQPATIDRVKHQHPVVVPCWGVSLVGGTQPDIAGQIYAAGIDDGLEARMLVVFPDPAPIALRPPVSVDARRWEQTVERLMQWREQSAPCQTIPFAQDATDLFARWRHELISAERATNSNCGWTGKLPGHLVRIALNLALLDAAAAGTNPPKEITIEHVRRAGRYVDFLAAHRRRIRLESGSPPVERLAREAARFIVEHRSLRLDSFEMRRGAIAGVRSEQSLRMVLAELDSAGWLDPTMPHLRRDQPIPPAIRLHPGVAEFWK